MIFNFRGVEFGGQFGNLIVEDFTAGAFGLRSNDNPRPQADGLIPGRDYLGEAVWAFDLKTNRRTLGEALETAAALEAEWKAEEVRLQPNRKFPISYNLDGRWRRVYGRPGSFAGPRGDIRARQGAASVVADFRVMDHLYYDEDETSIRLTIIPPSTGGLTAPLTAPLTGTGSGTPRAGFVTNEGNAATPLKATFNGPVTDPWVRAAAGWEIGLIGTLAYDVSVTVDPLEGSVLRNDGAPVSGMLSRATRLSRARLPKGQSELTFGGIDLTGTATVDLSWRNASTTI